MGEQAQVNLAVQRMPTAGRQRRAQIALYHAERRLHLPTLTVHHLLKVVPTLRHHRPEQACGWLVRIIGRPAPDRGNDAEHVELITQVTMMILAVVAGIGEENFKGLAAVRSAHQAIECRIIGLGAPLHHRSQAKMR